MFRIFKHYINGSAMILSGGETFYLFLQSIVIYRIILSVNLNLHPDYSGLSIMMMAVATTAGMACVGLYNKQHLIHYADVKSRTLFIIPLILISIIVTLRTRDGLAHAAVVHQNYLFWVLTMTAFLGALLVWRAALIRMIDRTGIFKRRVLILGSGKRAANIENLSRLNRDRTITIVGYLRVGAPPPRSDHPVDERRTGLRRRDYWVNGDHLAAFCKAHKVEEVVVASDERRGNLPVFDLLACKFQGIRISEYASFWERESGQVDTEEVSPSWLLFSDGFGHGALRQIVKRVFDIVISSLVLVMTLPITVPTAILIKLESKGPIFYRQERVGLNGRSFMVLKFRSMGTDAERNGPVWAAKNDTRVTKVGAFIRKLRIDEIPQVINVLRGDMAFVGPRPERPVFVTALAKSIPYYNERHVIKPGITGWAQINYPYGATEHDAKMKLSYDLYHIKNGGLFLDFVIMMQTIKVVIWHDGAR